MTSASTMLIQYLEDHSDEFLHNWRKSIVLSDNDIYKEEVLNNGVKMFQLVKRAIVKPLTEDEITTLANKTAQERVSANVNISEFVYNVNIGKSIVIKWVSNSGIELRELQPLIEDINSLFDRFSYLAVRKYTEIKEQQLQEKELYIDQTHKERLTILGQMSSSFVHEFRNPLTSIIGFTKLLQNGYPDLPYLDIMQHELEQLNYRISQFLHVSRKDLIDSTREEIFLTDHLEETIEFLYPSLLDGDVSIEFKCEPDIKVLGNRDELRQVFLNLIMNSIESAEMIKYSSNAFLATKISFINEIANLCEKLGANVEDVAKGMGMDQRIGSSFLQAGIGYGGSCFPKDTNALVQMAGEMEHDFELLESVIHVNAKQQVKLVQMAKEHVKDLKGKRAGILGLSFKPNTDDIREAASLEMIKQLLTEGVHLTVYDPVALENAKSVLGSSVSFADNCFEAIEDQDMLFIATEWEEFKVLRLKTIAKLMTTPFLFDGRNCFSLEEAKDAGIHYYSIGRPAVTHTSMKKPHSW